MIKYKHVYSKISQIDFHDWHRLSYTRDSRTFFCHRCDGAATNLYNLTYSFFGINHSLSYMKRLPKKYKRDFSNDFI
jgi:hypothetical protein